MSSSSEATPVPFHVPWVEKPQEEFKFSVDNTNQPFPHKRLQRRENGEIIHPLASHSPLDFIREITTEVVPPAFESTPFKYIEDEDGLRELASTLSREKELAVDLEHHSYRTYLGLTCLIQISTRTEDFIVDTLKLRSLIGFYLREVLEDPQTTKVLHGAKNDVLWLQRDFEIYLCNLFDTGEASKVLNLERNSLEFLLDHYCSVAANKIYQGSDWRLRPLREEMIRYAREDTHYLLYIYDLMRIELSSVKESEKVYQASYDISSQLYEKKIFMNDSYLEIRGLPEAIFDNTWQLAVLSELNRWRDVKARKCDESIGYLLPNPLLLQIAKECPVDSWQLSKLLGRRADRLNEVLEPKKDYVMCMLFLISHAFGKKENFKEDLELVRDMML